MKILITGGAGFVGSALASKFKQSNQSVKITVLDNLRRRGSELNLETFKKLGIDFVHGDIRCKTDLDDLPGPYDLFIEASAEPSVLAGVNGSPNYAIQSNLVGTLNCLEYARFKTDNLVFLSTSRVYSIAPLRELSLTEQHSRLVLSEQQTQAGASGAGISERFATHLPRSIYGATKLASELMVQEYANQYGLKSVINRCGVIAGPGQFGKVDQGVFTMWVANHYFGLPLKYVGFGGSGKQVRDLLHTDDLYELIAAQAPSLKSGSCDIYNVGGGNAVSTSLLEMTHHCREIVGREVPIQPVAETTSVDIPLYVTDNKKVNQQFNWSPKKSVVTIISEINQWIKTNEAKLKVVFAGS